MLKLFPTALIGFNTTSYIALVMCQLEDTHRHIDEKPMKNR